MRPDLAERGEPSFSPALTVLKDSDSDVGNALRREGRGVSSTDSFACVVGGGGIVNCPFNGESGVDELEALGVDDLRALVASGIVMIVSRFFRFETLNVASGVADSLPLVTRSVRLDLARRAKLRLRLSAAGAKWLGAPRVLLPADEPESRSAVVQARSRLRCKCRSRSSTSALTPAVPLSVGDPVGSEKSARPDRGSMPSSASQSSSSSSSSSPALAEEPVGAE